MEIRKKILIFIVAYKAEEFIEAVLGRIPAEVWENPKFDTEVLIIDDQSGDETFYRALKYAQRQHSHKVTVFHNPVNQGYGGNQKIGYHYAVKHNFDAVVLLHGDGQYPPEMIAQMVTPILNGEADVVLGSRMLDKRAALRGKMPLYKWIGNQVLTFAQNIILHARLAEFHTGYRAFSVDALRSIPFECNSNYYDFDTDIIIQLLDTRKRIIEIPIPTFYGKEISRVNGFRYAALIVKTSLLSRLIRWGIFYDPKFDYTNENEQYVSKLGHASSHQFAVDHITPGAAVVDLGSGPGVMAEGLAQKRAEVISVDLYISPRVAEYSRQVIRANIDDFDFDCLPEEVDFILMLDIIEHLRHPEQILQRLRRRYCRRRPTVVLTTANVAFLPVRMALFFGQFNYGKRGILDMDHVRLFTFNSLRRVLSNGGYEILEMKGIPGPFHLALGNGPAARFLVRLNQLLLHLSRGAFAYQIAVVARPMPTVDLLLEDAVHSGQARAEELHVQV